MQAFAAAAPGAPDRGDAVLLARFCAAMRPARWVPPPASAHALQSGLAQLHALRALRLSEAANQCAQRLAGQEALAGHTGRLVALLDGQLRRLERDIDTLLQRHPALARNLELARRAPAAGGAAALRH